MPATGVFLLQQLERALVIPYFGKDATLDPNMKTLLFLFFCLAILQQCDAQPPLVEKVEPPYWWVGMKQRTVQLMVYGKNLRHVRATSTSPSVKIIKTHPLENPSYTFIDLAIDRHTKPGTYRILLTSQNGTTSFALPLKERRRSPQEQQGFDASDVIYLIVPDRFVNGDTTNDSIAGMPDTLNSEHPYGRHGGDLQGIRSKLDYLQDLGVTTLWLTPVVENNTPTASYHGYAATDLYRIDPRLGTNDSYVEFVRAAHHRKLNVIMDHVNNHVSIHHPWIKNLPMPDWLNGTPEHHQRAFHSKVELHDPHSDTLTKQKVTRGWFTDAMPDLNQRNPFVATYLLQNTIWWIEFSGIDGIREDTFPYIDPEFRARWCKIILEEYPRFNIVGEVWVQDPAYLAPYQHGSNFTPTFDPYLPCITDFGLFDAFMRTFADTTGTIEHIFTCLTKDFLFRDPSNLVTFLDNHDIRRIMTTVKGDAKRFKLALTLLLTTRGIPQILYGTEIGMTGGPDHGRLRADFPGGFPHHTRNAFRAIDRTADENDVFDHTKHLLHIRKAYPALQRGTLVHFKPSNEVYLYVRTHGKQNMLIVVNHHTMKQTVDLAHYAHLFADVVRLRNVLSGEEWDLSTQTAIVLEGMTAGIFEMVQESL